MGRHKHVYVVTSGEYSDYHIVCVFLDRAAAQKYCEHRNRSVNKGGPYDECEVEEYPLNVAGKDVLKQRFEARIDIATGDVTDLPSRGYDITPANARTEHDCEDYQWEYAGQVLWGEDTTDADGTQIAVDVVSYVSQEHARKLAVEARQAHLRSEDEWEMRQREDQREEQRQAKINSIPQRERWEAHHQKQKAKRATNGA